MSYIAIVLSSTIPIEFWNRMIILCFLFISNKYAGGKLMLANGGDCKGSDANK